MTFQTKTAVSLTSWTDMNLNQCNKKLYIIHNLAFLAGACHSTYRKMFVLCNFKDIVALSYHTNVKTVQQILSTPGHTLRCSQAVVLDRQLWGVERTDCDVPLPVKFYKKPGIQSAPYNAPIVQYKYLQFLILSVAYFRVSSET